MARTCSVCTHPNRQEIDQALIRGDTLRDIEGRYKVSRSSLSRHSNEHLPSYLLKAEEAREMASAEGLIGQVKLIQESIEDIRKETLDKKEFGNALTANRDLLKSVELLGRLMGKLQESTTVNILVNPTFLSFKSYVLQALDPFPEAKVAVKRAIERLVVSE